MPDQGLRVRESPPSFALINTYRKFSREKEGFLHIIPVLQLAVRPEEESLEIRQFHRNLTFITSLSNWSQADQLVGHLEGSGVNQN